MTLNIKGNPQMLTLTLNIDPSGPFTVSIKFADISTESKFSVVSEARHEKQGQCYVYPSHKAVTTVKPP